MIQGTGKFVQDREKFDKENFEKEKDYSFLGVNFKGLNILFEIEGSQDREGSLYIIYNEPSLS